MTGKNGKLFVVATPIGNLQDLSPRAREVLESVALIAAEDTRHSRKLLAHYAINTKMVAYHDHNEREQTPKLLRRLQAGESIALISDAGTPLINDPGFRLLNAAHVAGIQVVPVPGPSAVIAALSVAGIAPDRFVFEGFLPAKSEARRRHLQALSAEHRTMVFFESSHRIGASLQDMAAVLGKDRLALLARELTKNFETVRRAPLDELASWVMSDADQRKGEFVIVIAGADAASPPGPSMAADTVLETLLDYLPTKTAVDAAARITGGKKNALYERALTLKKNEGTST